jgi:hypothetical protein
MVRNYATVGLSEATADHSIVDEVGISHPIGMRTNRKRRKRGNDGKRRKWVDEH